MTAEEAIDILDCERPYGECRGSGRNDEELEEALLMAINALQTCTSNKESEERNMEKLYVVTADGYDDGYGSEIYLLGVFKDEASAKALEEKYSHLEVTITVVELGKDYPLSPNERGWGLTYENDKYLGGYVE